MKNDDERIRRLERAAKKTFLFLKDLSDSNPGYMRNMVLQDYALWAQAIQELTQAVSEIKD